jgi:Flp pilus assembly protein TadG
VSRAKRSSEGMDGQILVIFALGLTAFIFVLALILDGGRVYAERRRAQNAADAAATAGAAVLNHLSPAASLGAVQAAACKAAFDNGFGSGVVDAACGAGGTTVQIHVPGSGDGVSQLTNVANSFEAAGYVQVAVTSRFTSFIQSSLGGTSLDASALAVAANIPSAGLGFGLIVLNPADCQSFILNGNGTRLTLHNGGVMVDSAAKKTGSPTCSSKDAAVTNSGDASVTTDAPFTNRVVGSGDAALATPPFINDSDFYVDPLAYVHVPNYGQAGNVYVPNATHPTVAGQPAVLNTHCPTNPSLCPEPWQNVAGNPWPAAIPPGVIWGGIDVRNNDVLILQGGTYIMAGGGLTISGGSVYALAPVTIIMTNDRYCNSGNPANCGQNGLKGNGDLSVTGTLGQATGTSTSSWGWDPAAPLASCPANAINPAACIPFDAPASNADGEDYLDHILIYIDRDIGSCASGTGNPSVGNVTFKAGGGGSYYFATGSIVYAPCSSVALFGNADPFTPHAGAVASFNISISGGKTLDLGGPGPNPPGPAKSNLVQ